MLGKIKKSVAGASAKIKAAGSDLIDTTSMKLAGKVFRVNNTRYKARRLIAEGSFYARESQNQRLLPFLSLCEPLFTPLPPHASLMPITIALANLTL